MILSRCGCSRAGVCHAGLHRVLAVALCDSWVVRVSVFAIRVCIASSPLRCVIHWLCVRDGRPRLVCTVALPSPSRLISIDVCSSESITRGCNISFGSTGV